MSMLGTLKELSGVIGDVVDSEIAEDLTEICEDLVSRVNTMECKYWKLVKTLAAVEKERDMLRLKLDDDMPLD